MLLINTMKNKMLNISFWFIFTHAFIYLAGVIILDLWCVYLCIKGYLDFWTLLVVWMVFGIITFPVVCYFVATPLKQIAKKTGSDLQLQWASIFDVFTRVGEFLGLKSQNAS